VQVDRSANYLIRQATVHSTQGKYRIRTELVVNSFKEVIPGHYCPVSLEYRSFVDNREVSVTSTSLSDISINPRLPNIFRLDLPSGTIVTDQLQGTVYKVNPTGQTQVVGRFEQPARSERPMTATPLDEEQRKR